MKNLLPFCSLPFLAGIAGGVAAEPPARPNILLILADDMGWTAPSCYGNKDVTTPNIDRLAAQGMRFTDAYVDAQCSPTRAALLSGQYGARTGLFKVTGEIDPLKAYMRPPEAMTAMPPDLANLAQTLRGAGYATGLSGKWHIANNSAASALLESRGIGYFNAYGFDYCGTANIRDSRGRDDKAVNAITDDIIGFIEKNKDRPWFAYVAHFSPRAPSAAPRELIEKHAARGYRRSSAPGYKFSERPTAEHLAMLDHFDQGVGRLLAMLDELRLSDHTVVILTSDNGGLSRAASNAPLREGKGSPYEGGIRVPLIVRWPGHIQPGSECGVPVHIVDFYPTFAELAGAGPPEGHLLDGVSLVPLWKQKGGWQRDALFWSMPTYTANYGRTPCALIRQGDWKLIHWFGDYLDTEGFTPGDNPYGKLVIGPRTELYNLRDDIGETKDLMASHPEKAAELKARLDEWLKDTGGRIPEKNPDYEARSWWKIERKSREGRE